MNEILDTILLVMALIYSIKFFFFGEKTSDGLSAILAILLSGI